MKQSDVRSYMIASAIGLSISILFAIIFSPMWTVAIIWFSTPFILYIIGWISNPTDLTDGKDARQALIEVTDNEKGEP